MKSFKSGYRWMNVIDQVDSDKEFTDQAWSQVLQGIGADEKLFGDCAKACQVAQLINSVETVEELAKQFTHEHADSARALLRAAKRLSELRSDFLERRRAEISRRQEELRGAA